jgi:predicted molibdopterin-dependent oxidoreductase YjgC
VNLQLARGNVGRAHTGLMPIRGHSGVQGGAEMGAMPGAYVMGEAVSEENARKFGAAKYWGFEPPAWKGLNASQMLLAAERGEIDVLWQSGGNFLETMPEPERVRAGIEKIRLRIHQDIMVSSNMLVEPAETVLLLPSRTRYEQRGGGTETSTERRVIFSPEIPGPRPGEARDEWEIPVLVARAAEPERAAKIFSWRDTQDIRDEIERVCPTYRGIAALRQKGDNFQYGGPRLLEERFQTPDGKGHFSAIGSPGDEVPEGKFTIATRRGKQFNAMVHADFDAITGLHRDEILMSCQDAEALELDDGEAILVRNSHGEYRGRVKIGRIKPGCLQGHWPELNVVVPGGCLDPSGVPDYNAIVDVIPLDRVVPAGQLAVVAAEKA